MVIDHVNDHVNMFFCQDGNNMIWIPWKVFVRTAAAKKISFDNVRIKLFYISNFVYSHDVALLGTQVLDDLLVAVYEKLIKAYHDHKSDVILKYSWMLIEVLEDMDRLLATDLYSLLGNWIQSAKDLGKTEEEKSILEYNARNQITLWGPNGQISDYANKNWAGLVKTYYANRWTIFVDELYYSVKHGNAFNNTDYEDRLWNFESGWNNDTTVYTTKPSGDIIEISGKLIKKYGSLFSKYKFWIE